MVSVAVSYQAYSLHVALDFMAVFCQNRYFRSFLFGSCSTLNVPKGTDRRFDTSFTVNIVFCFFFNETQLATFTFQF